MNFDWETTKYEAAVSEQKLYFDKSLRRNILQNMKLLKYSQKYSQKYEAAEQKLYFDKRVFGEMFSKYDAAEYSPNYSPNYSPKYEATVSEHKLYFDKK